MSHIKEDDDDDALLSIQGSSSSGSIGINDDNDDSQQQHQTSMLKEEENLNSNDQDKQFEDEIPKQLVLDADYKISRKKELVKQLADEETRKRNERLRMMRVISGENEDTNLDEGGKGESGECESVILMNQTMSFEDDGNHGNIVAEVTDSRHHKHGSSMHTLQLSTSETGSLVCDDDVDVFRSSTESIVEAKGGITDETVERVSMDNVVGSPGIEGTTGVKADDEGSQLSADCSESLPAEDVENDVKVEEEIPIIDHSSSMDRSNDDPTSKTTSLPSSTATNTPFVTSSSTRPPRGKNDVRVTSTSVGQENINNTVNNEEVEEKERSLFHTKLKAGFKFVGQHQHNSNGNERQILHSLSDQAPFAKDKNITSFVTVNFIDYTSTSTSATMAQQPTNKRRAWSREKSSNPFFNHKNGPNNSLNLNLYEKLNYIFQKQFQSTLTSVPYNNLRTNVTEVISKIPIRTELMGATQDQKSSNDPAEWHNGPFCHVYIAACSSLEHYRARVRPAIQSFVSQIEGAGSGNAAAAAASSAAAVGVKQGKVVQVKVMKIGLKVDNDESGAGGDDSITKIRKGEKGKREQVLAASIAAGKARNQAGGNTSCQYLIVFVPFDPSKISTGKSGEEKEASGLRRRIVSGGRRVLNRKNTLPDSVTVSADPSDNDSNGSNSFTTPAASLLSNTSTHSNPTVATTTASPSNTGTNTMHLSKEHKELLRKFTADFPNGRACILSTLLDPPSSSSSEQQQLTTITQSSTSRRKNRKNHQQQCEQEWQVFLQMLGSAVVAGFNEKIQNYDEELRRLDKNRAINSRSPTTEQKSEVFNWGCYYLIKESLSFTYQQMQLPQEALREYEELEALIPIGVDDENNTKNASFTTVTTSDVSQGLDALACGYLTTFRQFVRSTHKIGTIYYLIQQYIFMRQAYLLFLTNRPVAVIERFGVFIRNIFRLRMECCNTITNGRSDSHCDVEVQVDEAHRLLVAKTEAWVVGTCWDAVSAAKAFILNAVVFDLSSSSDITNKKMEVGEDRQNAMVNSNMGYSVGRKEGYLSVHKLFLCRLCDIMNFARVHLLRLGDLEFSPNNLIQRALADRPEDMLAPWIPWKDVKSKTLHPSKAEFGGLETTNVSTFQSKTGIPSNEISRWLFHTLESDQAFENRYLEFTDVLIRLNILSDRYRSAINLQAEQAEIHFLRGEYESAAQNLLPIALMEEPISVTWDTIRAWRLFRLACFQRVSGNGEGGLMKYMQTLTCCFAPQISTAIPKKVKRLLQQDLEAVVECPDIAEDTLGLPPFLVIDLTLEHIDDGIVVETNEVLLRKLVKKKCHVGDTIEMKVSITSNLPDPITVDSVKVLLLKLCDYEDIHKRNHDVTEKDSFCIFDIGKSIEIHPGKNSYAIDWIPMSVGKFVFSSIYIEWKRARFYHDRYTSKKNFLVIDVWPSNPTQTIEMNPIFLIPGHVQTVRLIFQSGSDIVTGGSVSLMCSNGLLVKSGNGLWQNSCSLKLGHCEPNSQIVLVASVSSEAIELSNSTNDQLECNSHDLQETYTQTLKATVKTSYHHVLFSKLSDKMIERETPPSMSAVLEAFVTTLERPALTIDKVVVYPYREDFVMISITVHCNTPVSFSLKEWDVSFVPPLCLELDGDLNKGLFEKPVVQGEEVLFGFKCKLLSPSKKIDYTTSPQSVLHVTLKDEFEKTFRQVLPLDLDNFYNLTKIKGQGSDVDFVTAKLTCAVRQGLVGAPCSFTYQIDLMTRRQSSSRNCPSTQLLYKISCTPGDWIIGGKIKGSVVLSMESNSFTLDFVGIPARAGILKKFPNVELSYLSTIDNNTTLAVPIIKVKSRHPDSFMALAYNSHMALAYLNN